jgi:hypothetical protein
MSVVIMSAAAIGTASAADETRSSYDAAVDELTREQYAVAFSHFSTLADAGHVPSALMALALVRYPPTADGTNWSVTPSQMRRWMILAGQSSPRHASAISLAGVDPEL